MPPPTKRQKQAMQQYASSSRRFDNGLIEDVLEVFLDPDYVSVSDAKSEADSESKFNGALSFSLIDGNIGEASDNKSESDDEAAMEIVVHATGEKWKSREDLLETLAEFEAEETVDYAEGCAWRAAVSAQKFWVDIMSSDVFSGGHEASETAQTLDANIQWHSTNIYLSLKEKNERGLEQEILQMSLKMSPDHPLNHHQTGTSDINITSKSINKVPTFKI
ncbi:hypothetical protein F4604DRAFT_1685912 [Suillus subluteus]|nr:hypothetical protein F4604DRAFT_1685912 [Suillus subluteus]